MPLPAIRLFVVDSATDTIAVFPVVGMEGSKTWIKRAWHGMVWPNSCLCMYVCVYVCNSFFNGCTPWVEPPLLILWAHDLDQSILFKGYLNLSRINISGHGQRSTHLDSSSRVKNNKKNAFRELALCPPYQMRSEGICNMTSGTR